MNATTSFGLGTTLVTGVFRGWTSARRAVVEISLGDDAAPILIEARTIVVLGIGDIGAPVLVQFTVEPTSEPIVMGRLDPEPAEGLLEIDGHTRPLEITAERELTLRCGKASITLTREGKIILRGTYISSRSSGANRIKGGSVQIN